MRNLLVGLLRRIQDVAAIRAIARRIPFLRFLTGRIHRSSAWKSTVFDPLLLSFGAPNRVAADLDRALPEFAKLFVAKGARASVVSDEFGRSGSGTVLQWGGVTAKQLDLLQQETGPLPVVYCFEGPAVLSIAGTTYRPLTVDWSGFYLNPRRPCDLELVLGHFELSIHGRLLADAAEVRVAAFPPLSSPDETVTVIVQDRSDPAFVYAEPGHPTPAELLAIARQENPGRAVRVVLASTPARRAVLESALPNDAEIIEAERADAVLETSRRIYTINSPLALGPLFRGSEVVVFGRPFYAGYGLTDDRRPVPRRSRTLDVDELFACVFGVYCRLLDERGRLITLATIASRSRGRR